MRDVLLKTTFMHCYNNRGTTGTLLCIALHLNWKSAFEEDNKTGTEWIDTFRFYWTLELQEIAQAAHDC